MLVGLVLVLVLIAAPAAYLVWRFRRGEESVAGGSMGLQMLGGKKDDWGPKS
jgi:flagellar biogenesis protein FliO